MSMMIKIKPVHTGVLMMLLVLTSSAMAADELNCVLCHNFRGLSRIDEDGNFRLFYINQKLFKKGPHNRVQCKDCHQDIDKIPHDPASKVDCTIQCHLTEPSGNEKFSHKPVAEILEKSIHGEKLKESSSVEHLEDYPYCTDCHDQPLYRPLSFFKGHEAGIAERGLSRCKTCHRTGDFAQDFYAHVTSRLQKLRVGKEIAGVCAKCHGDKKFQQRHELQTNVVSSYWNTFHGKATYFGSDATPDCIDCHVVSGENVHSIEGKKSHTSAVNENNVAATCKASECHSNAGDQISSYQVHTDYEDPNKYPMQYYLLKFFKYLMASVMYFFIAVIFLELLRRIFPNYAILKNRSTELP